LWGVTPHGKGKEMDIQENKDYRHEVIKDEIERLYDVMDFVFEEYGEIDNRRKELENEGKGISNEEMAQFLILEHMIEVYKGIVK
jgi:hypothetical protein